MRFTRRMIWPLVVLGLAATGCNQNPYLAALPPPGLPPQQQPTAHLSQSQDLGRRATALDADNQDLHSQLARAQQRSQLLEEHVQQLSKELGEKATELQDSRSSQHESQQQLAAVEASTRRRGSAQIRANNSLHRQLPRIAVPGVDVRRDGDVVRVELPGDQLFQPGTDYLLPAAQTSLAQVSAAIREHYPRRTVSIEGHTDSVPLGATSNHQLSLQQVSAIFRTLTSRSQFPSQQLFLVAHGPNHPRASNATPAGRSKNRRIELVIYPGQD